MTRPIQHSWRSSPWFEGPAFETFRLGRFVVVELRGQHRVLTTSSWAGGLSSSIKYLINHQSCEATGHTERFLEITKLGLDGYHHSVCGELGLIADDTAVMGTAANMMYASHEALSFEEVRVDVIVTAGVEGNAACAGDPARWVEGASGWSKLPEVAGTINTIVVVNQPIRPEAVVRALITITEGKTAALMELGVSSRYSQDLATGTGTDQICIASPIVTGAFEYTSTSPHSKLGELLGTSTRQATKQALRWQNGLEPSLTRSLFHALRRFGFTEDLLIAAMKTRLSESSMTLFQKNKMSVLHDVQLAAAAYAFASVLDRVRYGTLPGSAARDVLRQQAATMAASLSTRYEEWHSFWQRIEVDMNRPLDAIFDAIAFGWSEKWRSTD
jgi:adenosylcobinamide amidohydrolase